MQRVQTFFQPGGLVELSQPRGQQRHRGDVDQVVVEHPHEHVGDDAREIVLPVDVRDQITGHILLGALHAEDVLFQAAQAARFEPAAPDAPVTGQQIEMRQANPREGPAGEDEAILQHRQIEAPAVEADDAGARRQRLLKQMQLGALLAGMAHEELAHHKLAETVAIWPIWNLECPDTDQKRVSAGVRRQAGGLRVNERRRAGSSAASAPSWPVAVSASGSICSSAARSGRAASG